MIVPHLLRNTTIGRFRPKLVLLLASPLLLTAVALTCIPAGECRDVEQDRPPLPAAPQGAPPGGSHWSGPGQTGNPRGYEYDNTSPDDPMGAATPTNGGNSASVRVCNNAGSLSGPNGDVMTGFPEPGDCIEVEICWTYRTWESIHYMRMTETGYAWVTQWRRVTKEVCNSPEDVCPCP